MAIKRETLDGLLAGHDPQAVFAKDGLFDELKKALAERPGRPPPLTHQRTQSIRIANMRRERLNVADRRQAEWGTGLETFEEKRS